MNDSLTNNPAQSNQANSDEQINNLFADDEIITRPSKLGNADFSKRRRLEHLHDLLNRGNWTALPNELLDGVRLKVIEDRDFVVLFAVMSLPPTFLLKRSFLEGLCGKNDITKVTQKLIDWGCIQVEEISDERGSFRKLHHTRPINDWNVLAQINDAKIAKKSKNAEIRGSIGAEVTDLSKSSIPNSGQWSSKSSIPNSGDLNKISFLSDFDPDVLNPTHKARARMDLFESDTKPEKQEPPRVENPLEPTTGNPELRVQIGEMVLAAKNQGLFVQPNDLANNIGLAMQNLQAPFTLIEEQWPIAVLAFLESKERNPASAFFKRIKAELAYIKRQRQYDEKASAKRVYKPNETKYREPLVAKEVDYDKEVEDLERFLAGKDQN